MSVDFRKVPILSVLFAILLLIPVIETAIAQSQIINVNSRSNNQSNPVKVFLEAGTYLVEPIGTGDGGAFNAWNAWGTTSCRNPDGCRRTSPTTVTGWLNNHLVISPDIVTVAIEGTPGSLDPTIPGYRVDDRFVYPSPGVALANAQSSVFALRASGEVGFAIPDSPLWDNAGGLSFRISPESTISIFPKAGGDTGSVTVNIFGSGFEEGATVELIKDGEPEILGNPVAVSTNGNLITTTFDLTGKPRGLYDVVVENPDGTIFTLPAGFAIEAGRAPELWVDIIGRDFVRVGRPQKFWFVYGNNGNINAKYSFLVIGIPAPVEYKIDITPAVPVSDDQPNDMTSEDYYLTIIDLPSLPPNSTFFTPVLITAPAGSWVLRTQITEDVTPYFASLFSFPNNLLNIPSVDPYKVDPNFPFKDLGDVPEPGAIMFWKCPEGWHMGKSIGDGNFMHILPINSGEDLMISRVSDWKNYCKYLGAYRVPWHSIEDEEKVKERAKIMKEKWIDTKKNKYNPKICKSVFNEDLFQTFCAGVVHALNPEFRQRGRDWLWPDQIYDKIKMENDKPWDQVEPISSSYGHNGPLRWWEGQKMTQLKNGPWKRLDSILAIDPNDKFGAQGVGVEHYISEDKPLSYSIYFENLETATAPAQEVVITDQLDTENMDLSTFSLGPISFGNNLVVPPSKLTNYTSEVDLRPDNDLIVRIEAGLDTSTGILIWRFTSIDPETGEPPEDPLAGFLPPNINPPEGDGSVLFTVMPQESLATGTEIRNSASIVFDFNEPILTPEWLNTIDNTKPASHVLSLDAVQTAEDFEVEWTGADEGAGVRDFTILVSENDGPFTEWLTNTAETSAIFTGENGKTYSFYSIARDHTGNLENAPSEPDTITTVVANLPPVAVCQDKLVAADENCQGNASIDGGSYDPDDGDIITINQSPSGPFSFGSTEVTLTVTDSSGETDSCSGTVTVQDTSPPVISSLSANPSELWPPNHKMKPVAVGVDASDNCDLDPACMITEVSSDEPINGIGDGNTEPDWEITGDLTVNLRSERSGLGDGRTYTITVMCQDDQGNMTTDTTTVKVPHDMD